MALAQSFRHCNRLKTLQDESTTIFTIGTADSVLVTLLLYLFLAAVPLRRNSVETKAQLSKHILRSYYKRCRPQSLVLVSTINIIIILLSALPLRKNEKPKM